MPGTKPQVARDAKDFLWKELDGLKAILAFGSGKKLLYEIELHNAHEAVTKMYHGPLGPVFSTWGDKFQYVNSAFLYNDGSVIVCCAVNTWGGTFGDDQHRTLYYGLEAR